MDEAKSNFDEARKILERVKRNSDKRVEALSAKEKAGIKKPKTEPEKPLSPDELRLRIAQDITALRKTREDLKRMREKNKETEK